MVYGLGSEVISYQFGALGIGVGGFLKYIRKEKKLDDKEEDEKFYEHERP